MVVRPLGGQFLQELPSPSSPSIPGGRAAPTAPGGRRCGGTGRRSATRPALPSASACGLPGVDAVHHVLGQVPGRAPVRRLRRCPARRPWCRRRDRRPWRRRPARARRPAPRRRRPASSRPASAGNAWEPPVLIAPASERLAGPSRASRTIDQSTPLPPDGSAIATRALDAHAARRSGCASRRPRRGRAPGAWRPLRAGMVRLPAAARLVGPGSRRTTGSCCWPSRGSSARRGSRPSSRPAACDRRRRRLACRRLRCGGLRSRTARTKNPYSGARIGPNSRSDARNEKLPDGSETVRIVRATSSGWA